MLRLAIILLLSTAFTRASCAQAISMKDGRTIVAKSLRRQGDTIMATNPVEAGKPSVTGEIGYPLASIARLELAEPPQLRAAGELLLQGKGAEAVAQLDAALRYFEGFRDAPGSWWAPLALLKANALVSLKRDKEAEPIVDQLARLATDPETVRAARVQVAQAMSRRGEHTRALELLDPIVRESWNPDTLAAAAIAKGQSHLALRQWDPALISFLQIQVFYPEEKLLQAPALLGAGRAYFGLEDVTRARAALEQLVQTFGSTAEAELARTDLDKIARFEKGRAPLK
ncbi:MAG TPA: tetratricopeptide repeat protein [Chthoniobacteraceae bacterium]|jgi:tetratricopeptide (TPR) repeat protein